MTQLRATVPGRTYRIGVTGAIALAVALAIMLGLGAPPSRASDLSGAVVASSDCTAHEIPRNDDLYSSSVDLPFSADFYGQRYDHLWVNNNGNVTFDAPLSTYTPFGLQATSHAIIAPFFADVDTRAAGSDTVKYGWGQTTYQGRRAFCANWLNVGYYNQRADKLNSFQLLLVDRSDQHTGDFDIVFNYGSITWETGDASGGINGLGGDSARVGFSNGDGTNANSYELPGSGIDGSLLDGSSRGLIHGSIGSSQLGRYVYEIRNGQPAPSRYVAMGDSYSSGLGAGDYGSTDGQCYRSANAYAHQLVDDGTVPFGLDFVACAGAETDDLRTGMKGEGPQLDRLGPSTALTTVGIGGNDLGFAPLLKQCLVDQYTVNSGSCAEFLDDQVFQKLMVLNGHTPGEPLNKLQRLYADIRARAPRAKLVVPGYPRFFPVDGATGAISTILGFSPLDPARRCEGLRISDQLWINQKIYDLDTAIAASARSMGGEYAAMYDAFDEHELCHSINPLAGNWLHGIRPPIIANVDESFHPTEDGQTAYADRIRDALQTGPGSTPFIVHANETITNPFDVLPGLFGLSINITWPGSTVKLTVVSPSGHVYGADDVGPDGFHLLTPTSELIYLRDPEPGRWTVRIYGADVRPEGEETLLTTYQEPKPNAAPVARMTATKTAKDALDLDAGASTDADGQVVDYLWDFGDGTFDTGRHVQHVFAAPGTYRVTLTVQDDDRALGFDTQDADFTITPYDFSGFKSPVNNPPTVNTANAGRAIPVKFSLGGSQGLDIFDPGYPKSQRIDCASGAPTDDVEETVTAGQSELSYDAGSDTYNYVWKTDKAWAGTCRRLIVGLNDATDHHADFELR